MRIHVTLRPEGYLNVNNVTLLVSRQQNNKL